MARDFFADVIDFHAKYGLEPPNGSTPSLLPEELAAFRRKFLHEEYQEFVEAHATGNLHDAADALADLVYVALGTAVLMGIPFDQVWDRVHAANMTKVRVERASDSKRGSSYDVVKPPGFSPPSHHDLLGLPVPPSKA